MIGTPAKPLEHRVRRCVLRCLHGHGSLTAAEISNELGSPMDEVHYHLRVLAEHGMAAEKQRGIRKVETIFESQIGEMPEVIELLVSTRAEDEAPS